MAPQEITRGTSCSLDGMVLADFAGPKGQIHYATGELAYYVLGSKKICSMGPTLAAFALQQDADKFTQTFGGKVLPFDQITPNMMDLTGGVVKDEQM